MGIATRLRDAIALTEAGIATVKSPVSTETLFNDTVLSTVGNVTVSTFSPYSSGGKSYYFDGNGSYLTASASAELSVATGPWTWEAYFYPQKSTSPNTLISVGVPRGNLSYVIEHYNVDNFAFGTGNGWNWTTHSSDSGVLLNSWNHLAIVHTGSNILTYLNGQLKSVLSPTGVEASYISGLLYIGTYYNNTNNDGSYFKGYISDLRFTKAAVYSGDFYSVPNQPLQRLVGTVLLIASEPQSTTTALPSVPNINSTNGIELRTSGNSFVVPDNVGTLLVTAVGGGSGSTTTSGGNDGGWCQTYLNVTAGQTINYTVGQGGGIDQAGGTTSVGTIQAFGGTLTAGGSFDAPIGGVGAPAGGLNSRTGGGGFPQSGVGTPGNSGAVLFQW